MFTFYILYSELRDRYYIGYTGDIIAERLRRHNSDHKGFTGRAGDWILKYSEQYNTKELAYKREREVKGWKSRGRIEFLIKED